MSNKRKPTILQDKWNTDAMEAPEPCSITAAEVETLLDQAFPLSLDTQKEF